MKIVGYEFREGARFQPKAVLNAKAVGAHLEMLRQKFKGELTPQDVLDDAKHNNSPLHSFFEWRDGKAATEYRLAQARGLIRAVVAIYKEPDKRPVKMAAFVHIAEGGAPHYRDTAHALSQSKTRAFVLQQAWREFMAWRRRYKELDVFSKLFEVADQIELELSGDEADEA